MQISESYDFLMYFHLKIFPSHQNIWETFHFHFVLPEASLGLGFPTLLIRIFKPCLSQGGHEPSQGQPWAEGTASTPGLDPRQGPAGPSERDQDPRKEKTGWKLSREKVKYQKICPQEL